MPVNDSRATPFERCFAWCISCTFSSKLSTVSLASAFRIAAATRNDMVAPTAIPAKTETTLITEFNGVIAKIAIIEPGEAGALKPAPNN